MRGGAGQSGKAGRGEEVSGGWRKAAAQRNDNVNCWTLVGGLKLHLAPVSVFSDEQVRDAGVRAVLTSSHHMKYEFCTPPLPPCPQQPSEADLQSNPIAPHRGDGATGVRATNKEVENMDESQQKMKVCLTTCPRGRQIRHAAG